MSYSRYHQGGYSQPTPSSWPLSEIRSSARSGDDSQGDESPEGETFDRYWAGERSTGVPYQERILRNLYGRTVEESLAGLYRLHNHQPPSPSDEATDLPESEDDDSDKEWLYGQRPNTAPKIHTKGKPSQPTEDDTGPENATVSSVSSPDQDVTMADQPVEVSAMEVDEEADDRIERPPPTSRVLYASSRDTLMSDLAESSNTQSSASTSPPRSSSDPADVGLPPHCPPPPTARRRLDRPLAQRPMSQLMSWERDDKSQAVIEAQRLPRRRSAPSFSPTDHSDEEGDEGNETATELPQDSSSASGSKPKVPKRKPSQPSLHTCKQCNISFTRNFDLQRHNQKHKSDTQEDKARRTCTNCGRVLSRVDATKRHVDTMPDSCNYIRKKEGKAPIPLQPPTHYDACKAQYHKLAEETKKPKGRKKANAVAS